MTYYGTQLKKFSLEVFKNESCCLILFSFYQKGNVSSNYY